MPDEQLDRDGVAASLGLLHDAPRDVVKAIVAAARTAGPSDPAAVEKAMSAFNLATLFMPGMTAATLAARVADLARSGSWAKIVEASV
jgi:hypothetical protein